MMKWLERAKREIPKSTGVATDVTADRNLMSATAVLERDASENSPSSFVSNGSAPAGAFRKIMSATGSTTRMTETPASHARATPALGTKETRRWLPSDIEEAPPGDLPQEW